jgi:hypothetical protein
MGGEKSELIYLKKYEISEERLVFPTKLGFFTRKHWGLDPNLDALDVIRGKRLIFAKLRCYQKICFASRKWGPKKT